LKGNKAVTVKDIAKRAGVSSATVSMVLNNDRRISEATREKVSQAIQELNYSLNGVAQSLRTRKSRIIGLIVPSIMNPFYPEIASGVEEAAERAKYSVLLCNSLNNPHREEYYIHLLLEKRADGIIFGTYLPEVNYGPVNDQTHTKALSLVSNPQLPGADFLVVDQFQGTYRAVSYLLSLGHVKIAFIGRRKIRFDGYEQALRDQNLTPDPELVQFLDEPVNFASGEHFFNLGRSIALSLLQKRTDITAIFAYNDLLALGAINAAKELGLRIPEDISIMGYDDNPYAKIADPPLTTIKQPKYERGVDAVRLLLERFTGERAEPVRTVYPTELLMRKTTQSLR
jgi:LacI family transcriptional regulator